jgi:phosphatidylinositol alpha-mannosyltransferase
VASRVPTISKGATSLRIALYHSTLPEEGRKPGGVEQYVHRLGERLTLRGHHVVVASFVRPPADARYRWCALRPENIGRSQAGRLVVAPLLLNRRWERFADVLHLHGDDWFFFARRLPTVRTFHGSARREAAAAQTPVRRWSQYVQYPLEVCSSRLATVAYGVAPGNPTSYRERGVLSLGIDMSHAEGDVRSDGPAVLFVGTWEGRKRGRLIHRAFCEAIRPAVPSAELWMVSDECEPAPGVIHYKGISDAQLVDLYEKAWVFCLPSMYEGFGIPYLEAMAHGAPVVSTPNAGAKYVTRDGEAALLVTDSELGPAVTRLLGDKAARRALAARGRSIAEEFSWEKAIQRHEDAYALAITEFR